MDRLTTRQAEVVRLLAAGRRPAEIARALCVSRHTVYAHTAAARARTETETTTQLALRAAREVLRASDQ